MKYKLAVVSKGFITGFPPDLQNAKLIDIEAVTLIVDAPTQLEAEDIAVSRVTDDIYCRRGGGPLWVAEPIACMEWEELDDELE